MSKTVIVVVIIFAVILFGLVLMLNGREVSKAPVLDLDPSKQQPLSTPSQVQSIDKQASFAIFTNGIFRVFTAAMYHNLSLDAYIEASNPNIIKIKKERLTWNDFFSTLPFKLTNDCLTTGTKETFCTSGDRTLQFYINGEKRERVLDLVIQDGDKLLITYGNESGEVIKKQTERIPNP